MLLHGSTKFSAIIHILLIIFTIFLPLRKSLKAPKEIIRPTDQFKKFLLSEYIYIYDKALTGETFTTTTDRLRPVNNVLISFCDKSNRTDASFAFIICSLTEAKGLWPLVIAWRGGERGLRGLWSLLIAWRGGERGLRGLWSLLIAWLGEEKGLRGLWSLLIAWQGEERSLRGLWSLLIAWRGGKRGLRGLWSLLIAWREWKRGLRGLWSLLIA